MAYVKNVEKRIWDIEGFAVAIKYVGGRNVRSGKKGLKMYSYDRAAKNDMTVAQWIDTRFHQHYPGFDVVVFDAYGDEVNGMMRLGKVRDTCLEEE